MTDTNNAKKAGAFAKIGRFFKETRAELKKVTWPTREQLIHNTGVIITFIIITCIILSLLDFGFGQLVQWIIPS
ncbi:MAG: preprotein translocase subunit SecE [Clostridia bacterium]|nr:preprotein translocase subunit SecE [Clostridia bacterium]